MISQDNIVFSKILSDLSSDPAFEELSRRGLCRAWSGYFLNVLRDRQDIQLDNISVEARQAHLNYSYSHTFLRIIIGKKSYILDGTGLDSQDPYFGPEDDAPHNLRESVSDEMINREAEFSIPKKERYV